MRNVHGCEHPALTAWRQLRAVPEAISVQVLSPNEELETPVYRLAFRDPEAPSIVAKRCPRSSGLIERAAYENILATAPVSAPRFYGFVEGQARESSWLFIEDVSGRRYDPENDEHREAAARWLAGLHIAVRGTVSNPPFARRGPGHYLTLLQSAAAMIRFDAPAHTLSSAERSVLIRAAEHCANLIASWHEVEDACADLPYTFVHGDFIPKNVFVRKTGSTIEILPFDWEKAGWGVLAEDLSTVDLDEYRNSALPHFPDLTMDMLARAARAGKVFRSIVFINWVTPRLSTSAEQAVGQLECANSWLDVLVPSLLTGRWC